MQLHATCTAIEDRSLRRHSTTAFKATNDYEDAKIAMVLLSLIWLIHRVSAMPGIAGVLVGSFLLS